MKSDFENAAGCRSAAGLACAGLPSSAKRAAPKQCRRRRRRGREILKMKNANALYANTVPNVVLQTKDTLLQAT